MTSVDRTAYPRFGRVVSGRELTEAFTPTDAEVEWARGRTQDLQHLLALIVWLKSYQRLGYFPKVEDVPPVVVRHVRGVLGLAEDVELERARIRPASPGLATSPTPGRTARTTTTPKSPWCGSRRSGWHPSSW